MAFSADLGSFTVRKNGHFLAISPTGDCSASSKSTSAPTCLLPSGIRDYSRGNKRICCKNSIVLLNSSMSGLREASGNLGLTSPLAKTKLHGSLWLLSLPPGALRLPVPRALPCITMPRLISRSASPICFLPVCRPSWFQPATE